MVPKKPLPETPVTNPPPKPKRSDVSEAIYINTNDVEKLLNEIYEDSKLTEEVKPEVKKRALKKIRQERMEESKSIVRGFLFCSSAIEIVEFCNLCKSHPQSFSLSSILYLSFPLDHGKISTGNILAFPCYGFVTLDRVSQALSPTLPH